MDETFLYWGQCITLEHDGTYLSFGLRWPVERTEFRIALRVYDIFFQGGQFQCFLDLFGPLHSYNCKRTSRLRNILEHSTACTLNTSSQQSCWCFYLLARNHNYNTFVAQNENGVQSILSRIVAQPVSTSPRIFIDGLY